MRTTKAQSLTDERVRRLAGVIDALDVRISATSEALQDLLREVRTHAKRQRAAIVMLLIEATTLRAPWKRWRARRALRALLREIES